MELVQLPYKTGIKNPCVPINMAVAKSRAPAIFLSSPECVHSQPILAQALAAHNENGPKSVVVCAVFDQHQGHWFSHSEHAPEKYHFANLMSRQFFYEAGGFDEDYRDGYCFDDPDFVERLKKHNAIWVHRDDLLVRHEKLHKKAKRLDPDAGDAWSRNGQLFYEKWGYLPVGAS